MRYTVCVALFLAIFPAVSVFADTPDPKCRKCFEKSKEYIRNAENLDDDERQKQDFLNAISSFIADAEYYLNSCTDAKKSLLKQSDIVTQLLKSVSHDCPESRAAVQFIDINKNGDNQLILHSVLRCNNPGYYDAGFSLVFFLDSKKEKWKGYNLYPVKLLNDLQLSRQTGKYLKSVEYLIAPEFNPKIYMLDFRDSKGRTYMAIESDFGGGNYEDNNLSVIRWEGHQPKEVLELSLRDWCGQPCEWIIKKDGTVIVPAAKATEWCKARKKKSFSLEKDCGTTKCYFDNH